MSAAAPVRSKKYSLQASFLDFWSEHLSAIMTKPHRRNRARAKL
ncbi:MAG: hypothetical protein QM770_08445 [Tepidisphaeraceae bacterium]